MQEFSVVDIPSLAMIALPFFLCYAAIIPIAFSFMSPKSLHRSFISSSTVLPTQRSQLMMNPLEGTPIESIYSMVKAREACPPQVCVEQLFVSIIRDLELPEGLIHWGHPIAMGIAVLAMGGYGIYQGLLIRSKEPTAAVKAARSSHPTIMTALFVIMFIGAQGGLSSLLVQRQPILESPHSATALLVLLMFFAQAILGLGISSAPALRNLHTYFGFATAAALLAHIYTGINLGISI